MYCNYAHDDFLRVASHCLQCSKLGYLLFHLFSQRSLIEGMPTPPRHSHTLLLPTIYLIYPYKKYSGSAPGSIAFVSVFCCKSFSGAAAKTLKYRSPVSLTSSTLAIFPQR